MMMASGVNFTLRFEVLAGLKGFLLVALFEFLGEFAGFEELPRVAGAVFVVVAGL
jgi:hypothetical protein